MSNDLQNINEKEINLAIKIEILFMNLVRLHIGQLISRW